MAKDRNFDRNRVRGCNFGSEGGAVLDLRGCSHGLGGAIFADCTPIGESICLRDPGKLDAIGCPIVSCRKRSGLL